MIVRTSRSLDPISFAAKYPKAHVAIGHVDPGLVANEAPKEEPTLFAVLISAASTLGNRGECTGKVERSRSVMRLSFELGEDAARLCALVRATPVPADESCASKAVFQYDPVLLGELMVIHRQRQAEMQEAYDRGESIQYADW